MKKILALLLALCMVFAFAACGEEPAAEESDAPAAESDAPAAEGDNVIKIGVFEPLTGDSGAGGKQEMLGMQYANYLQPTVDVGGVEYTVELVPSDNGSDSSKAPTAASQLVSEGVSIVLGTYGSSAAIAAGPIFEQAQIPAIGVTCTNPQVTIGNEFYFRACFIDPFQGTVLANYAFEQLGARKAYMLGEAGNDYDAGLMNYFQEAFEALGGTVVSDNFQTNNSDFTSYLNKAVSEQAEVVFIPVSITYSTQIIAQAKSMDLNIPILGSDTLDNNTVLAAAADSNLDLIVTTFYNEGGNAEFDEGFKEWINSDSVNLDNNGGNDMIAAVSVMGFDAYNVALEAIKLAGSTDPVAIKDALWDVNYDGITGNITFGENGDAVRDTAYIKISDNVAVAWTDGGTQTVA